MGGGVCVIMAHFIELLYQGMQQYLWSIVNMIKFQIFRDFYLLEDQVKSVNYTYCSKGMNGIDTSICIQLGQRVFFSILVEHFF